MRKVSEDELLRVLVAFFNHEFAKDALGVAEVIDSLGVDIDSFVAAVKKTEV